MEAHNWTMRMDLGYGEEDEIVVGIEMVGEEKVVGSEGLEVVVLDDWAQSSIQHLGDSSTPDYRFRHKNYCMASLEKKTSHSLVHAR